MALLGIDYGTTNTVAVAADRGHYPVVPHLSQTAAGAVAEDVFPSFIAFDGETGALLFGAEAERAACRPGAEAHIVPVRGLKRYLRDYCERQRILREVIPGGLDLAAALREFLAALRRSIQASGLFPAGEPLNAVITWPANANGAQRYVTRRGFAEAGFNVAATVSEPAAAAIEYADRVARGNRQAARALRQCVAIFDLGGGTFDASVVRIEGPEFTVLDTVGIERLGGDDFDMLLAGMFAEKLKIRLEELSPFQLNLLLRHARRQKETAGTARSLTLEPADVMISGLNAVSVRTESFLSEVERMLEPAVEKMEQMFSRLAATDAGFKPDAVYLAGGSSRLPVVPRLIARRLPGVKIIMTDKPFCAVAMGAAIRGAESARARDILSRTFGVIRIRDSAGAERFDPIFPAGTRLPQAGEPPLKKEFVYAPRHNIGRLRYLECAVFSSDGIPAEGVRPWSEAFFPYDPALPETAPLEQTPIVERNDLLDTRVCESYTCDSDGVITAGITRCADGYSRAFEIFRT